jgi:hypothetical protein
MLVRFDWTPGLEQEAILRSNSILRLMGMKAFSIWKPSRGPSS